MTHSYDSIIWRVNTSPGSEPTGDTLTLDKIEFNEGAVVNANGYLTNTRFVMGSSVAVNEMPGSIDKLQDTGVNGITIYVSGSITDPSGNGKNPAHKFKEWMLEPKTNTVFPKGLFGLRLDDFPVFDLTPTADRGYILTDVEFVRNGDTKGKLEFIATLRFSGTVGSKDGNGDYTW
jgi:hypothetical protein